MSTPQNFEEGTDTQFSIFKKILKNLFGFLDPDSGKPQFDAVGPYGSHLTAGGSVSGSTYRYIYAHAASVVSITSSRVAGSLGAVNIPAGGLYPCYCEGVVVTSGEVTVYQA